MQEARRSPEEHQYYTFGKKNLDFRENPAMQAMEQELLEDLVQPMYEEIESLNDSMEQSDRDSVETIKERKKNSSEEYWQGGEILEAGMMFEIERGKVFGPQAKAYKTSDYDDWIGGTDFVVTSEYSEYWKPEKEREELLAHFSVDVTVSSDPHVIKEKQERIIRDIDEKGEHFRIKYPPLEQGMNEPSMYVNYPRIVLAIDANTYASAVENWANGGDNEEFRIVALEEARAQFRGEVYLIISKLNRDTKNEEIREMAEYMRQEIDDETLLPQIEELISVISSQDSLEKHQGDVELLKNTARAWRLVREVQKQKEDSYEQYPEVLKKHYENDRLFQQVTESVEPSDHMVRLQ